MGRCMTKTAIIPVFKMCEDDELRARSFLAVGGISVLERQLRQCRLVGVEKVILLTDQLYDLTQRALKKFHYIPKQVSLATKAEELSAMLSPEDQVLLLEEGVLQDTNTLKGVVAHSEEVLVFFGDDAACTGINYAQAVSNEEGHDQRFASIGLLTMKRVQEALKNGVNQFWDSLFQEAKDVARPTIGLKDLTAKSDAPFWRPLASETQEAAATKALLRRVESDQSDWISQSLHKNAEMSIATLLNRFPLRTMVLMILAVGMGLGASWAFYMGHIGLGLAGGLLYSLLWGTAQKISFVHKTMQQSQPLLRVVDQLIESSWLMLLAWSLVAVLQDHTPWILMAMTILFSWAIQNQLNLYKSHTGRDLYYEGRFGKWLGLWVSTRVTRLWLMVIAAFFISWLWIPWVLASYTALSFFMVQYRSAR